ncbi:MAG: glycosyltransferase family 2 protein [bacterium]
MKFSIIIPARNEEKLIPKCLDSIKIASVPYPGEVETIVCINRCTDKTEDIARSYGAKIVHTDAKNLAKIRNTAAATATGEIIVTIDADCWMAPNLLTEIEKALSIGKYIGGGVNMKTDRVSFGILISAIALFFTLGLVMLYHRISGGSFWCYRKDFEAIHGFDERFYSSEDLDFAKRLKSYGKTQGKQFKTLWKTHIIASSRKGESLGDWYLLKHPTMIFKLLGGKNQDAANKFYYDCKH